MASIEFQKGRAVKFHKSAVLLRQADIVKDLSRLKFRKFGDTTPPRTCSFMPSQAERKYGVQWMWSQLSFVG